MLQSYKLLKFHLRWKQIQTTVERANVFFILKPYNISHIAKNFGHRRSPHPTHPLGSEAYELNSSDLLFKKKVIQL